MWELDDYRTTFTQDQWPTAFVCGEAPAEMPDPNVVPISQFAWAYSIQKDGLSHTVSLSTTNKDGDPQPWSLSRSQQADGRTPLGSAGEALRKQGRSYGSAQLVRDPVGRMRQQVDKEGEALASGGRWRQHELQRQGALVPVSGVETN